MSRRGTNIYKRKDGRWEARFIKYYDETGKARYGYLYARSYREVRQKLLHAFSAPFEISAPSKFKKRSGAPYSYWLDRWLEMKHSKNKSSTYVRYKNHVENHIRPALGNYPAGKISTALLEAFIRDKLETGRLDGLGGLSPKTVADILLIVKGAFLLAGSEGVPLSCSLERITVGQRSDDMRVLTVSEEKRLLKVLLQDMDQSKLGVYLCLFTGLRIGELCALKWENISLTEGTIKITRTMQRLQIKESKGTCKTQIMITPPKTMRARRTIPLPGFLTEVLRHFSEDGDCYLLTGKAKVFLEPRTMQNHFKQYARTCGIEANFHALRHTFTTRCMEAGFDIKTLSDILGHSSVKITLDRYMHPSMELKKSNMEKLRPPS